MNELNEIFPLVSVIIPCYNHEEYIEECIQSVIKQDYQNIELIIINDGSKDKSALIIETMRSACASRFERFEFISRENLGLCNTLNQALEWCKGRYVATIASDDVWFPFKTRIQVNYLETHSDVVAVFGGIVILDENGNELRKITKPGSFKFKDIFLQKHFLPAPTSMIRKQIVQAIGYDPVIRIEDWDMWLKLSRDNEVRLVALNEVMAGYRRHQTNVSANAELMYENGLKILSQYAENTDYKLAVAEHELAMSAMLAIDDKRKSITHFILYLQMRKFSLRMFSVLLKILIPGKFFK